MNSTRIRDLGLTVGHLPTGPLNKITDVPGVRVGHCTIDTDRQKTGVTVILPAEGNLYTAPLTAACHVINGFGKSAGLMQVQELGTLETPIALTGTLNVGRMCDALVSYTVDACTAEGRSCRSVNPVVGETNDGTLSCNHDRPAGKNHLDAAIAAACRDFAEGDVGAGKGTVCFGLKGGIGSASRVLEVGDRTCTLGVLVQTNFGCVENLRMDGLPVGRAVVSYLEQERATAEKTAGKSAADGSAAEGTAITGQDDIGSIMIIVGTDLPVSELQLGRILRRATVGLARTGSFVGHGSGDVVIGFTTANRRGGEEAIRTVEVMSDGRLETAFTAVAECVEEAIYNSMIAADTVTGFNGKETVTVRALNEFIRGALPRARAMAAGAI